MSRVYNFRPGPAMLPLDVIEEVHRELIEFPGAGMSTLEISHRTPVFQSMMDAAIAGMRRLADIPPDYHILFLGGGASLQFAMAPMNLMAAGATADHIVSGVWGKYALDEANKIGKACVSATTETERFARVPRNEDLKPTPGAAYVHMTSNNTDVGTQWTALPDVGSTPLVSDMTSDIFSRPIPIERHALIYAGAQKNLGIAGVTLVIIHDDLLARSSPRLPTMLSYRAQAEHNSLYNTPPVFAIYILGRMIRWLLDRGGLQTVAECNARKAARLYAEIDRTGFYCGLAGREDRSVMNVTFRLPTSELDTKFVASAAAEGLDGLAGHRSIGGIRASIYNAFPEDGVLALAGFMREFERTHG